MSKKKEKSCFRQILKEKATKEKTPINGAHGLTVSRHQTSDDHDHASIKANKR